MKWKAHCQTEVHLRNYFRGKTAFHTFALSATKVCGQTAEIELLILNPSDCRRERPGEYECQEEQDIGCIVNFCVGMERMNG